MIKKILALGLSLFAITGSAHAAAPGSCRAIFNKTLSADDAALSIHRGVQNPESAEAKAIEGIIDTTLQQAHESSFSNDESQAITTTVAQLSQKVAHGESSEDALMDIIRANGLDKKQVLENCGAGK